MNDEEILRKACIDAGCMNEGDEIPSEIPQTVAIAAIMLGRMVEDEVKD